MHHEVAFVALLSIAACVALVARCLKFPYTVALVLVGVTLGATRLFTPPHLTKELLYSIFLPGLLFEAAFHLDARKFRENVRTILSLAVPGVALCVGLTAALLIPVAPRLDLPAFTVGGAVVFAALISATDPIAVVAVFRSLGAPKRLTVLVEGESLLNDGTSVVFFTIVVDAVSGGPTSLAHGALQFATVVGMGVLLGGAVGALASIVIRRVDDTMIEITITTIAAYGSFVLAETFAFSGVGPRQPWHAVAPTLACPRANVGVPSRQRWRALAPTLACTAPRRDPRDENLTTHAVASLGERWDLRAS